nr:hypothetical protein [Tanacetum cinerariifolium]
MKYQALKRKPLTEAQARRNMIVYLKNIAGYKMYYFMRMSYDEIRPHFEKHYNYNQAFLNEVNEGVKLSEKEVSQEIEVEVESSKREGESLKQEIAKKPKMEQDSEELKKHLQIIPDDVYTDATPLASKIPIIDYKIHTKRNRPYFKIVRADGNHSSFLSFSTMLKNFDREYLKSLWKIFRERFAKTEPKNYSYDFFLNTLKIMFEKANVEANVWKYQKGNYGLAKVKRWKLFESCGVHCLILLTTRIFLLVERIYLLTHFTLEKMVNDVRLEVEDESEMSLELLRLVKRQLNEGSTHQQDDSYKEDIEVTAEHRQSNFVGDKVGREWVKALAWLLRSDVNIDWPRNEEHVASPPVTEAEPKEEAAQVGPTREAKSGRKRTTTYCPWQTGTRRFSFSFVGP